jgi:hypothetical protein
MHGLLIIIDRPEQLGQPLHHPRRPDRELTAAGPTGRDGQSSGSGQALLRRQRQIPSQRNRRQAQQRYNGRRSALERSHQLLIPTPEREWRFGGMPTPPQRPYQHAIPWKFSAQLCAFASKQTLGEPPLGRNSTWSQTAMTNGWLRSSFAIAE